MRRLFLGLDTQILVKTVSCDPQEHLDRALRLRDDDPVCYFLLGRWCFEVKAGLLCSGRNSADHSNWFLGLQVASLDWLEKKAAAALYRSAPTSSLHDALENFLKVRLPSAASRSDCWI